MNMKNVAAVVFAALLWPLLAFAQVEVPATVTFDDPPPWAGGGSVSQRTAIYKAEEGEPMLKRVGSSVYVRAGTQIEFGGQLYNITTDQAVTLPTLVAGTDYRVAIKSGGTFQAYTYADTLPAGAEVLAGFHFFPGSPATGLDSGGGWTPTILDWSMWDKNFRPSCLPQGMTKTGHTGVWIDIYFQGNSSNTDGVTRNADTILTGTNPPLIPADYGGNGTAKYSTLNWWEANEHLAQFGKRLPTYGEMVLAAFGTNEGSGRGSHPVKNGFATHNTPTHSDPNFTSKWGLYGATGTIWIWTASLSDWQGTATTNPHGWQAYDVTGGRGKLILQNDADVTSILFGASSVYTNTGSPTGVTAVAGSRTLETLEKLWDSSVNIAVRGACDHVQVYR